MATAVPHKNDVLLGKGTVSREHNGNQQFRSMVDAQRLTYVQTHKRKAKRAIALQIMQDISSLDPPGRFLMESKCSDVNPPSTNNSKSGAEGESVHPLILSKIWITVDHDKAREKVLHRLRGKDIPGGEDETTTQPSLLEANAQKRISTDTMEQSEGAFSSEVAFSDSSSLFDEDELDAFFDDVHESGEGLLDSKPQSTRPTNGIMNGVRKSPEHGCSGGKVDMFTELDKQQLRVQQLLHSPHGDTSDTVIPISLQEWMNKAILSDTRRGSSQNGCVSYYQSAVNLALVLTKHLLDPIGTEVDLKTDHITSANLVIFVRPEPLVLSLPANQLQPEIKGVKFHSEDASVLRHSNNGAVANSPAGLRQTCTRLGNILLEIFSKGQFISMKAPHGDSGYNQLRSNSSSDDNVMMPSIAKRMASVSLKSGDSVSDKAKRLLLDTGAPLSSCRLVCDLLNTMSVKTNSRRPITLRQALWDLNHMKNNPQMYLFDRTSPEKALDDTRLFDNADDQIFGREGEMNALMKAKNTIARHCSMGGYGFLFEASFLSGYAGSGKSCLLRSLINKCEHDKWFVLRLKFDSKSAPLAILANAFDDFFGRWNSTSEGVPHHDQSMMDSFQQVCRAIFSACDSEAFSQLCEMIPNLSRVFPHTGGSVGMGAMSLMGAAGAAENRLVYLVHILFNALCSSGRPVLLALDDLQWSDSFLMAGLSDFAVNFTDKESFGRQGLLAVGTYRNNELKEGDDILENILTIKNSRNINVTKLDVGELSVGDVTHFISAKLGLPLRYTLELAKLVHRKSKGNPFFITQFLKTITNNKMLEFSVRGRMWTWDCGTIDLQMISEGVAELLASTFDRLPTNLLQTLKIISLFGNQIDVSTIDQINSIQRQFDMIPELDLAVKEGLLEKAGPFYAFSHDLIHQTLYDRMPAGSRRLLHKTVGDRLLECPDDDNHTTYLLAVDQINLYYKDGELNHEEGTKYAKANSSAAKYAMMASSFEKARSYVDMGIKLLQPGHWDDQYALSLELYEMSASLCYMCGHTTKMSDCLNEIITHSETFQDSLNASAMLASLLSSSSRHCEAIKNCLVILAQLGEEFPPEPDLAIVQNKLSEVQPLLLTLTADKMKALPTMTDTSKLQAMKFLGMLCEIGLMAAPMLLPLLSVRMMKLTFQFGFCSDSVLGIFYTASSVFFFTDDVPLAYQVGKIGVMLREESQCKHFLRSRLIWAWEGSIRLMVEPLQAVIAQHPSLFKSAMLVGDVQNAMFCRYTHCVGTIFAGEVLTTVSNHFALCIQQSAKYQQHVFLNMAMAWYRVLMQLSGKNDTDVKSYDDLYQIGKESNNTHLLFNVIMSQISVHFWFRDYTAIMKLCEKHPAPVAKRILATMRCLFEGIAALNLARQQPNEPKYRVIGEKAVKDMSKFEQMNMWVFENKSLLLQAELHYLNQDSKAAEDAYIASIKSAKAHKFMNEEAMANELFGIFCIENQMNDKGSRHLSIALDLYKQWGAMKKAADLEKFIKAKASVDSR